MQKVMLSFPAAEAEMLAAKLIDQLEPKAKLRLVEKLERETRRLRWGALLGTMQKRFAKQRLSAREVRRICEQIRKERADASRR